MLVRYIARLKEPINFQDHWPVPIMGGDLRAVTRDKKVIAFEITFSGRSVDLSPAIEKSSEAGVKNNIRIRDNLLPFVKKHLEEALAYLQCYFDVEILIDEIEAKYVGETEEEERQIKIKSFKSERNYPLMTVPFDIFSRAIMAAEKGNAPRLEANFVRMARTEMLAGRYIDSFRYSFLLIEFIYGEGKYKTTQLKNSLKGNAEFVSIVSSALKERILLKHNRSSDTKRLLAGSPKAEVIIDHIVEKRGFYFHGNLKGKNIWKPHEQEAAEALCLLSLGIAMLISQDAAAQMFDDSLVKRYFDNAKRVGAIMTMTVNFQFCDPIDNFDRKGTINFNAPGTKVTSKMALDVAKNFLSQFEETTPMADLRSATCTVAKTGQKVFDIKFHTESSPKVEEDTQP